MTTTKPQTGPPSLLALENRKAKGVAQQTVVFGLRPFSPWGWLGLVLGHPAAALLPKSLGERFDSISTARARGKNVDRFQANDVSFQPLDRGARLTSKCFWDEDTQANDILIADDHRMLRDGSRLLFEAEPDFRVVGQAGDGEEAVRLVRDIDPEILLLELHMPRLPGLEVLRELVSLSLLETPRS